MDVKFDVEDTTPTTWGFPLTSPRKLLLLQPSPRQPLAAAATAGRNAAIGDDDIVIMVRRGAFYRKRTCL